jgi:hypothetical protein
MAVKDHAITVDSLIEEADALKKAAVENKQISAAVSALTLKAKLAGLWIERAEQRTPAVAEVLKKFVDAPPPETREQWLERRNRELDAIAPPNSHANGDPHPTSSGPWSLGGKPRPTNRRG